jgi:hypothetical protein
LPVPSLPSALRTKCTASAIEAISKQANLNKRPAFIGKCLVKDDEILLPHHLPGIESFQQSDEFVA